MSQEHKTIPLNVALLLIILFAMLAMIAAWVSQEFILVTAANDRQDRRESAIASLPSGITRVQTQGVEQEIKSCMAHAHPFVWLSSTLAEELILEREQYCIDKIVQKIAMVDADAAAALAHVIVEGPFNASQEVQAIARDDPQALKAVASLLAR